MLLVKTLLDLSSIHGIGLFTEQFIPKDTIIWRFNPLFDLRFPEENLDTLPLEAREQVLKYSYRERSSRLYVLCGDDARFFNHSETPNCIDLESASDGNITKARVDITAGTELTCDYSLFDLDLLEGRYSLTSWTPGHEPNKPAGCIPA
jgi:SET domain-containing protein